MSFQIERSDQRVAGSSRNVARSRCNRSRRVRMSYPAALVELALLLCGTFGALRATSELGIGKSTLYRWRNAYRTAWMPRYRKGLDGRPDHWTEVSSELYARCERAGFSIRSSLLRASVMAPIDGASVSAESDRSSVCEQVAANHRNDSIPICSESTRASEKMIRAKREIDSNYASKQSINRLAGLVALPRIKFIKEFTATFGVSPYRYLLGVRFRQALALLEYSKASFAVVASATGFGTAASMQYAFKRFAGVTPAKLMNTIAPQRDALVARSRAAFV
jgi:AraC-like DNA-binding protein